MNYKYITLGIDDCCLTIGRGKGWLGEGCWLGGGIMLRGSISLPSSGTARSTGAVLGHSGNS